MSGRVPQKLWLGTRWGARGDAEETVDGQLVYLIGREGLLDPDLLRRDHSAVGAEVAVDVLDLVQTIDKRIGAAGRVVAGEPPAATLEQEAVGVSGGGSRSRSRSTSAGSSTTRRGSTRTSCRNPCRPA